MAAGSDLTLPEVVGPRPLSMRITNAYIDRVLTAAETDPVVAEQFLRVSGMIDPPARLLRPSLMIRVARTNRRRRRTDDGPFENLTGPLSAGTSLQ
jgi:hypothetical protein